MNKIQVAVHDARKALYCLRLEVSPDVGNDVAAAVEEAFAAYAEAVGVLHDALKRLDALYRDDVDLGDPEIERPAWLAEALDVLKEQAS